MDRSHDATAHVVRGAHAWQLIQVLVSWTNSQTRLSQVARTAQRMTAVVPIPTCTAVCAGPCTALDMFQPTINPNEQVVHATEMPRASRLQHTCYFISNASKTALPARKWSRDYAPTLQLCGQSQLNTATERLCGSVCALRKWEKGNLYKV